MNDLNSILVEGVLICDPRLMSGFYGIKKGFYGRERHCRFSIEVKRCYKQDEEYQQEISYFDIVIFGRLAETCAESLKKGRGVRVVGRLKQNRWKNAEGVLCSDVIVVAEHMEFKPPKQEEKTGTDQAR